MKQSCDHMSRKDNLEYVYAHLEVPSDAIYGPDVQFPDTLYVMSSVKMTLEPPEPGRTRRQGNLYLASLGDVHDQRPYPAHLAQLVGHLETEPWLG